MRYLKESQEESQLRWSQALQRTVRRELSRIAIPKDDQYMMRLGKSIIHTMDSITQGAGAGIDGMMDCWLSCCDSEFRILEDMISLLSR